MTDDAPVRTDPTPLPMFDSSVVLDLVIWSGYVLAVAGVVLGVVQALHRVDPLPGQAIALVSAMLGILIGLCGMSARATFKQSRSGSSGAGSSSSGG